MSNWIPTFELRWINRKMPDGTWHTHILQQKWITEKRFYYEDGSFSNVIDSEDWRDVPVVEGES